MDTYIAYLTREAKTCAERKLYDAAFELWHGCWRQEFQQLVGSHHLYADGFTRQDQILTICTGDEVIGLTGFRHIDLTRPWAQQDSYFQSWPTALVKNLSTECPDLWVCGFLTIASQWRGHRIDGMPIHDLLAAASIDHFMRSDVRWMVANTRNSKGVNRLVYRLGGRHLDTVTYLGEPSDLILFDRTELPPLPEYASHRIESRKKHHKQRFIPVGDQIRTEFSV